MIKITRADRTGRKKQGDCSKKSTTRQDSRLKKSRRRKKNIRDPGRSKKQFSGTIRANCESSNI